MSSHNDSTDRQAELARLLRQRVTAPLAKAVALRERGEVISPAIAEEVAAAFREALALVGLEDEAGQGPRWGQPGEDNGEEHGEDGEEAPSVRELIGGYWDYVEKRQECAGTGLGKLDQALMGGLEAGRRLGWPALEQDIPPQWAFSGMETSLG
ncbi:MAG: hypothetical protein IRZ03_18065 [Acidobacterium ailaaui]|nr:hypothetical protein [Pseudacidobacterium ailaaui]